MLSWSSGLDGGNQVCHIPSFFPFFVGVVIGNEFKECELPFRGPDCKSKVANCLRDKLRKFQRADGPFVFLIDSIIDGDIGMVDEDNHD